MSNAVIRFVIFCGLIGIAPLARAETEELKEIFKEFSSSQFDEKIAVFGKIKTFDFHIYSSMYRDIDSVTVDVSKFYGSKKKKVSPKQIKCKLPSSGEMIAPFDTSALDKTRKLSVGKEAFLLLGKNKKGCTIVHLSEISTGTLLLPAWKEWKDEKAPVIEAEALAGEIK